MSSCDKTLSFAFTMRLELWFSSTAAHQNHLGSLENTGCPDSSSEGASSRAYLVSSCDKTLSFAFTTRLELWFSSTAVHQNHLGSLGNTGYPDSTLDRGI